ncbi:MAG: metal-dependent hydrolase, partial [Gemmatimonadaceae bacterium]
MDNVCHSLAGAVIAQAGFAKRFPRATLLCIVGANIPDVDAFTYIWADSLTALQFRRGWTHGIVALGFWTLLLTAVFWWWHRRDARQPDESDKAPLSAIFLASFFSVWSHTSLDWLNNYGVRWLMPFSERWFYGDTLFIVDLTLLLLFGGGWWLSRRRRTRGLLRPDRPARLALALALAYIVGMKGLSEATRSAAKRELGIPQANARQLMVSPKPVSLLMRDVLVRSGASYDWYEARVTSGSIILSPLTAAVPIGAEDPRAIAAAKTAEGRGFLRWSRFP